MTAQFTTLESIMAPLPAENVDTDQIIPARFLKITDKNGLADKLFNDWRYLPDGSPNPDFVLNQPTSHGAKVLLAGDNFGCGSSREHAPWALVAWGFRAIISTSFADIFQNNSLKNGLVPVAVEPAVHRQLFALVERDPNVRVHIDLESQTLTMPGGGKTRFPVDSFAKHCLLNGIDELGYLRGFQKEVAEYESRRA